MLASCDHNTNRAIGVVQAKSSWALRGTVDSGTVLTCCDMAICACRALNEWLHAVKQQVPGPAAPQAYSQVAGDGCDDMCTHTHSDMIALSLMKQLNLPVSPHVNHTKAAHAQLSLDHVVQTLINIVSKEYGIILKWGVISQATPCVHINPFS